jgi:Na+/proline symporter
MSNKKIVVIALLLVAIVAGVALAASVSGVEYSFDGNRTYIQNNNSYGVSVFLQYRNGGNVGAYWLEAGEKGSISGDIAIGNVTRIKPANPKKL